MFETARVVPPRQVADSAAAAWARIAAPGTWLTGERRIAVAREVRAARDCELCMARKQALSPYSIPDDHKAADQLSAVVVDAIHRIVSDPGRLTERFHIDLLDAGVRDVEVVEVIATVCTVVLLDTFAELVRVPLAGLPAPRDGAPTRVRPNGARVSSAWVPTIDPDAAEGETEAFYGLSGGASMGFVPNIMRAMSAAPAEMMSFYAAAAPLYMLSLDDPPGRTLTRPQIELISTSVSLFNDCFY